MTLTKKNLQMMITSKENAIESLIQEIKDAPFTKAHNTKRIITLQTEVDFIKRELIN